MSPEASRYLLTRCKAVPSVKLKLGQMLGNLCHLATRLVPAKELCLMLAFRNE